MSGLVDGLNQTPPVAVDHYREIADTPEDKRRRVVAAVALAGIALFGVAIAVSSGYLLAHSVTLVSFGVFIGLFVATLSTTATVTLLIYHFHKNSEQRRALGSLSYPSLVSMAADGSLSLESLKAQLLADAKVSYAHFVRKIGPVDRIAPVHLCDEAKNALASSYLQTVPYDSFDAYTREVIPVTFQSIPGFLQKRATAALDFFDSSPTLSQRAYVHFRLKYNQTQINQLEEIKERLKRAYLRLGFTDIMAFREDAALFAITPDSLYNHLKIPMFQGNLIGTTQQEHEDYLGFLVVEFKNRHAEEDLRSLYNRIGTLGLTRSEEFNLYRPLFCPIEPLISTRETPRTSPPPDLVS